MLQRCGRCWRAPLRCRAKGSARSKPSTAGAIIPEMIGEAAWVAGDVHLSNGDLDAARDAYDRAVRELPRNSALWVDVARFRAANADTAGARDAVDYAIELDKANSTALAYKANLIRTEDGLTASLPWYDRALAADPDNADALIDQAATLGDLGRYGDMLVTLRHAATIVPGNPRIYYLQAVLAARADNYRLARSLLQRTRGAIDGEPGFMLLSAVVELELGGEAVAATWADRLLVEQPNNFTARRILAAANWADGDADGAVEALLPIIDRPDADSWSLLLAARATSELGRRGEAAEYLARAATLTRGEAVPFAANYDYGVAHPGSRCRAAEPGDRDPGDCGRHIAWQRRPCCRARGATARRQSRGGRGAYPARRCGAGGRAVRPGGAGVSRRARPGCERAFDVEAGQCAVPRRRCGGVGRGDSGAARQPAVKHRRRPAGGASGDGPGALGRSDRAFRAGARADRRPRCRRPARTGAGVGGEGRRMSARWR